VPAHVEGQRGAGTDEAETGVQVIGESEQIRLVAAVSV
jgi:hypothetical protein